MKFCCRKIYCILHNALKSVLTAIVLCCMQMRQLASEYAQIASLWTTVPSDSELRERSQCSGRATYANS